MKNPAHLSGPRHLDNLIVTPNFRPSIGPDSYRDLQKHMTTLTPFATAQGRLTATHYCSAVLTIRRAVSIHAGAILGDKLHIARQIRICEFSTNANL